MTAFKIVGRFKKKEEQRSWDTGKEGTQAKKRVYVCEEDYNKYSPELIKRWEKMYNVEVYKMVDGKWILLKE